MARLEFYRQQVVPRIATPSTRGLAAVGAQAAETAEAVARGATALGRLTADLDELRVEDAYNKLREKQTDLTMNPETGFMNKRAADAVDPNFMPQYSGGFDKAIEEVAGSLASERQKDLFRRRAQIAKAEYSDSLMRHVMRETEVYRDNVYTGAVATETNTAALNWKDSAKIKDSIGRIAANTAMWAERKGLKGDALMAEQLKNLTTIHATVIQSALDAGDYEYAKKYYEDNKTQINAPMMSKIESALESGSAKDQSLKLALDLTSRGISFSEQRKELKSMYAAGKISADVYDQTSIRVNNEEVRAKSQETDFNNAMSGKAQEWIINNPGKPIVDMPPNLYNWAKSKGQLDTLTRFANSGGEGTGDNAEFTRLYISSADDPISFMKEFDGRSNELMTVLSKSQYNSLLTRRGAIGKGELQNQQATQVAVKTVKLIRNDLIAAGLDVTPKEGTVQAQNLAAFQSQLIEAIEAKTQAKGSALTADEARKVGLDLLREGRLVGAGMFGFDKTVRRFEADEADIQRYGFRYSYADIPPADQKRLYRIIQTRPDVREQLGIKLTPNKTITSADFERGIELLYTAELDGATY